MPDLFGLTWSPAVATMRMLKVGVLKPDSLRPRLLNDIEKEIQGEIKKRQKKHQPITFEVFAEQIYKDEHYTALYKELGITSQINDMIKSALPK